MAVQNADAHTPANPAGARRDDFEDFPRQPGNGRPLIIRAEFNPATGRWEVPRTADGEPIHELVPFTRASTLGGAIEYQGNLLRWKAAVAVYGVVRSRTLAKRARAVAGYSLPDQKAELYEIVDGAKVLAEESAAASHGTALHTLFQRIVEGDTVDDLITSEEIDEEDIAACRAFATAITRFEVLSTETRVVCDEAQAAGKYDAAVTPRRPMPVTDKRGRVLDVILPGERIPVDYKTSSTPNYFGPKFCVQLWVYAHGRLYDKTTGERTENGMNKRWALILHVPRGSDVAEWYWVDLATGEKLMQVARSVLEGRKQGKHAIVKADLDADIPPELLERAKTHARDLLDATAHAHEMDQMSDDAATWSPAKDADADQALHETEHEHYITEEEYRRQQAEREVVPPGSPLEAELNATLTPEWKAQRAPTSNGTTDAELLDVMAGLPGAHADGCNGDHPPVLPCPDPYLPTVTAGVAVAGPAPSTTAVVNAELVATSNGTTAVPIAESLGPSLQRAAAVAELMRRIAEAPTLLGLLDLYNKADQHGYMSPGIKAACTARKLELQAKARETAGSAS